MKLTPFGKVAVGLLILAAVWLVTIGIGYALVRWGTMAYTWWRDETTDGQYFTLPVILVLATACIIASVRKR